RFEVDKNEFARSMKNLLQGTSHTALTPELFEQPLLVTFYECRKLALKPPWYAVRLSTNPDDRSDRPFYSKEQLARYKQLPAEAFQQGEQALQYLRDVTYTGKDKQQQRGVIDGLLRKLRRLWQAPTRTALDTLIADSVKFVLPAEMTRIVVQAACHSGI